MTLLEAFRELAPPDGDDAMAARRKDAMTIVYQELHSLARRIWPNAEPEDRKDVASKVFMRLAKNGPRGVRDGDPSSDAGVSAYLAKAIKNGLMDIGEERKKFDTPETVDDFPAAGGPAEQAERHEARRELEEAHHQLFEVIVPELAQLSRSGAALVETVRQLREIAAGRLSVRGLLNDEFDGARDEAAIQRARNRLDQRFGRARGRIDEEITRLRNSGQMTEGRAGTLKAILEYLKLRQ